MNKNKPEFKPRLQDKEFSGVVSGVGRHPEDEGEVELTDKEIEEKELEDKGLENMKDVKTTSETTGTVDLQNPAFDPEIPEQKQRNFR